MQENDKAPVAIVTGGASGIGKAIGLALAKAGYRIFLFDSNTEKLKKVVENEFKSYQVQYHCGDVSNKNVVNQGFLKCISAFGQVNILVSNVGIIQKKSFLELKEEEWDRVIEVNLKGCFLWGQIVAKWMVTNKVNGSIINISCIRSELTAPYLSSYSTSKAGVSALTKSMAVELGQFGINVNAIQPGRTQTEGFELQGKLKEKLEEEKSLVPLKRFALPEEIANVAVFLASDKAKYINGAMIPVDGGYICSKS